MGVRIANRFNKGGLLALLVFMLVLVPFHFTYAESWGEWLGNKIAEATFYICVRIGSAVLWLGAVMLDYSIWKLIIEMGDFFQGSNGLGEAVRTGWTLLRDVLNMTFIFALIYIGIKTILDSNDSGTRRALGLLIGAALLINFSLFITQTIVDFSNLMSVQVYKALIEGNAPGGETNAEASSPIADKFMSAVGLTSFFSKEGMDAKNFEGSLFLFSLFLLVFFVLAGIAFMLGSILVLTRFIALILFMVFSPLMFLGWILPKFKNISDYWWTNFFRYSFFAPIYLFLLFISLRMLQGMVNTATGGAGVQVDRSSFAKTLAADKLQVGGVEMVLYFVIMIGLLWASLKVGDKLGMKGGAMTVGAFNSVGQGVRRGARGFGGRIAEGMYDGINRRTDGGLSKIGGERVRRIVTKEADKGFFVESREATKKDVAAGMARIQKQTREAKYKEALESTDIAVRAKAIGGLSGREVVEKMKDPDGRKEIMANIGHLTPAQIKAISDDKDMETALVDQVKTQSKEALLKKAAGDFGAVMDQLDNNPKEIAKVVNGLMKGNQGRLPPNVITELTKRRGVVRELGKHLDSDHFASVQNLLGQESASIRDIVEDNRFW